MSELHQQRDCILCKSKRHDKIILAMVVEEDEFVETFHSGIDELRIDYNHTFDENQNPFRNSLEVTVKTNAGVILLNTITLTKEQIQEFCKFKIFGIINTGALQFPSLHEFELIIERELSHGEFEIIGEYLLESLDFE